MIFFINLMLALITLFGVVTLHINEDWRVAVSFGFLSIAAIVILIKFNELIYF